MATKLDPRVPVTTRKPREGERDGINYHFIDRDQFESLLAKDLFKESGEYKNELYGTLKPSASTFTRIHNEAATNGVHLNGGSVRVKNAVSANNRIQTTILRRNDEGRWDLILGGGLQDSTLVHVHDDKAVGLQVSNSIRPMTNRDCILAVDGHSVAGRTLRETLDLLQQASDMVELTVLLRDTTSEYATLDEFMRINDGDSEELKHVKEDVKNDVHLATVPYTTRVPKEGETDGVDYHFITRNEFQAMIDAQEFVEHGEVNGVLYGTRRLAQDQPSDLETKNIARKQKFRRSRAQSKTSPTVSSPKKIVIDHPGSFAGLGIDLVDTSEGVFISHVRPETPAAKAGLQQGLQVLAANGHDVTRATAYDVRNRLDHTDATHDVVVRFNPRGYSVASRQLLDSVGEKFLDTVILDRNSSGSWGVVLTGGVEEGELVTVQECTDVNYVAVSNRELMAGDCLLAVDGVSVTGSGLDHTAQLLRDTAHDVELTILRGDRPGASNKLVDFFATGASDPEVLAALKADVKNATYTSTVPYTTRAPREGEVDGKHYNFITQQQFKAMQQAGKFVEWGERQGVFYGTAVEGDAVKPTSLGRKSSRTARALAKKQGGSGLQTVLLGRNASGNWGLELTGGVDQGMLPTVAKMDDVQQVAYTTPLQEGDSVLAINGVSIAGVPLAVAQEQMAKDSKDLELTVLTVGDKEKPTDLKQVFDPNNTNPSEELRLLQQDIRADIYRSKVPYTTRVPKEGETDGVDYHFINRDEFQRMLDEGLFLEHGEVNGVLYGTSLEGNTVAKTRSSVSRRVGTLKRSTRPKRFVIKRNSSEEAFGMDITDAHSEGVVISAVEPQGAMDRAGLRPGMQITNVNGKNVNFKDISELAAALTDAGRDNTDVTVVARYVPSARDIKPLTAATQYDPSSASKMADDVHVHTSEPVEDAIAQAVADRLTTRVHLWCTPRSLSTATMYSFAQRSDTTVVDEPLYAPWLARHPEVERPYRDELLQQETDVNKVIEDVILGDYDSDVVVFKHIAKQFENCDSSFLKEGVHAILVRNPINVLGSYNESSTPTLDELSFPDAVRVYSTLKQLGLPVVVVDSDILAQQPETVLRELCQGLGLEFDPCMLSWTAGPKEYDGLWAPVWYKTLHTTTGFAPSVNPPRPVPPQYRELVDDSFPFYYMLRQYAIGAPLSGTKLASKTVVDHGLELPVLPDARNANLIASVNGVLVPRGFAVVSAFDSAVQGGDAVWEGLRVYNGKVFNMLPHLTRMIKSAKAMGFDDIPTIEDIQQAVFRCLAVNNMRDGVHIRLTLSRGLKTTSSMNPNFNVYGSNLIVLPEWKPVEGAATYDNSKGVKLVTASQRRNPPQCVDSKIHHCNLINNILPKIQANQAGAADAVMLDIEGFVSETNATNLFAVIGGKVVTPHADFCLPGTTRRTVLDICAKHGIDAEERRVSLAEFHSADEVFTTGSMGELTPVYEIDGRTIGDGNPGPITQQIQAAYRELTATGGVPLPF